MTTARDRVAKGAALLDKYIPDWRSKVDPKRLDIASGAYCIVGQVYRKEYDSAETQADNSFSYGIVDLAVRVGIEAHLSPHYPEGIGDFDVEHGFMDHADYEPDDGEDLAFIDEDGYYSDLDALTAAWLAELAKC
jgi:hypothetical protein